MKVESYAEGRWHTAASGGRMVFNAVTGEPYAEVSSAGLDHAAMLHHARQVGGHHLRKMTIHQRAMMLKGLALALNKRKAELYALSRISGATNADCQMDVDGGIGTLFVYSSKARRELADETFVVDGPPEIVSRGGTYIGQHIMVPRQGVALHINAFNFPCWGMLEKLAPTLLAGMPAIVKPASVTSYITAHAVRIMIESGALPPGALQLVSGSVGDMLDQLGTQDVLTLTGSAHTGRILRRNDNLIARSIPFNVEADSMNFCMLGPDAAPGTTEFDLFIKEVSDEMRIKTGQRCTAIRRCLVPADQIEAVRDALSATLSKTQMGDPAREDVQMGPLVSQDQRDDVDKAVNEILSVGEVLFEADRSTLGADAEKGAFYPFKVLYCSDPMNTAAPHDIEPFGPVSTILPYKDTAEAVSLIRRGEGSLVGTLVTASPDVAREVVLGTAAYHGRLQILNRACAKESTGHGSPLPHLTHGGPGRAGGGQELGGLRALDFYMQRTALQGAPEMLTQITGTWLPGADRPESTVHPFRKYFEEVTVGDTLTTHRRTVTEADIVNFAGITGDYFYAHMDEIAAKESIFGQRVAHGYFVLSAAAGLFVDAKVGPVLANYGLERLRFIKPVGIGDTIQATLTAHRKITRQPRKGEAPQGVVEWNVDVTNQDDELVANYVILTLVARKPSPEQNN
ncbi:MAG: phenylacetic acid degradation bifunctional protein PaaZ [Myxococcota bacterium]